MILRCKMCGGDLEFQVGNPVATCAYCETKQFIPQIEFNAPTIERESNTTQQNNPYIFISYAHKDDAVVMNILRRMKEYGLNLWYDNGIEAGSEWPTFIANQLKDSACFLALMSKNYIASKNCRREFNFADKYNIPILVAYLEDFVIEDAGMDMQISLNQCAFRSKFRSDDDFIASVCRADMLQCCKLSAGKVPVSVCDTEVSYVENFEGEAGGFRYTYTGEMLGGKRHGKGKTVFSDGETYEGEYRNGNLHGYAECFYATGNVYKGEFVDGKCHGKGRFIFADGDIYEGEYRDDKRNGKGTYVYANGNKYEGDFLDGMFSGYGVFTYANGEKYVGEFRDNKFHGNGRYIYADGSKYEGVYEYGQLKEESECDDDSVRFPEGIYKGKLSRGIREGKGTMIFEDGTVFEAYFRQDKPLENCRITYANGDVYEGANCDYKRHGLGKLTYADGTVYDGVFRDDMRAGGKITYADGTAWNGSWDNDKEYTGEGVVKFEDGVFIGQLSTGRPFGIGRYEYNNGDVYEGDFLNGNYDGEGKLTYSDGSYWEGTWDIGEVHTGHGTIKKENGRKVTGKWRDGKKVLF